jgi:Na+/H+ antiporter NhaC
MAVGSFGVLSLAPPLIAIVLAMYTRQVLISLYAGVWIGALLVANWNPVVATTTSIDWIVQTVRDPWQAKFILLIMFMGAGAAFIYKSGSILALERWVGDRVDSSRESTLLTWLIGIFIFFDSYTSTVVTGNATREISQDNSTSRELHSYVLDSTTSPVTTFGPVSNWIGFQVSMISEGIAAAGIAGAISLTPFAIFLKSIPWNMYCLMAFFMVGLMSTTQRFYGPMLDAEWRSRVSGESIREDATPLSDVTSDVGEPSTANPTLVNFFLPILVLLGVGIFAMWWIGGGAQPGVGISEAFTETNVALALLYAAFAFMVTGFAGALAYGTMGLEEASETVVDGFKTMLIAIAIIILAWSIGLAASKVGTAAYIVDVMVGSGVPAGVLPIIVFLAAMFVSFTTGTSWGTMGILTPIAVPLGYEFAGPEMLPVLMGVLFGGAIWGDHSSPISDTTVMSSIFAGSDHIDHVNTQIPLALTAAGATLVALVLYSVGIKSILVLLPLSAVLTVVGVYGLNKFDASRKNLPEVLPSRARIAEHQDLAERIDAGTADPSRLRGDLEWRNVMVWLAWGTAVIYIVAVFVFASLA